MYRALEKWGSLENIQLQKDIRTAREKQEHASLYCFLYICHHRYSANNSGVVEGECEGMTFPQICFGEFRPPNICWE